MIYTRVSRLHFSPASEKIFRLRGCLCRHITWRSVPVGAGSKPARLQHVYLSISGRFRTCPYRTTIISTTMSFHHTHKSSFNRFTFSSIGLLAHCPKGSLFPQNEPYCHSCLIVIYVPNQINGKILKQIKNIAKI